MRLIGWGLALAGDEPQRYISLIRLSTGAGGRVVGAGGVRQGDYPTQAHKGRPYKGLSRAWWEPHVGQAHALQVWPRSVDVTRTIYSRTNRPCRLAPAHQGMKIGCIG